MMRCHFLIIALMLAGPSVGCRKLALEPRSTLDAEGVYQDYTVENYTTFSGTSATLLFNFDAVFRMGSKNGSGMALPAGSAVTCNGLPLYKAFAGTAVNYHLTYSTSRPTEFAFVWTEPDGTTHKNTISYPANSAAFEAPATTISRSTALQMHWFDSTPASSTVVVGITQPSGQAAVPTIARGATPLLKFSTAAMSGLGVGSATFSTKAAVVSSLLAPTAAGGQGTFTDTANYPVSITN